MGRHIHSKKASWGPGAGAVLLQVTPTTAEHKGGPVGRSAGGPVGGWALVRSIPEGSLAHCSSSARLARPVPDRLGLGQQCGVSVGQSVGAGSWPWRLTLFRVVLCPKAQAFQKGKKEEQSCGCWRSSRLEDGVLSLSLRARLRRSGELSARA